MSGPVVRETAVQSLRLEIKIVPEKREPADARAVTARDDGARPTLPRPTGAATRIFQGWGPRLL